MSASELSFGAPERLEFLGLPFDTPTLADAIAWIERRRASDRFAYVVTPNVDHIVRLDHASETIRAAYAEADLLLCDSRIVAGLAAVSGIALTVVTGADLTAGLLARHGRYGSICLIGGSAGDLATLGRHRPDLRIVQHQPPMGLLHDREARARAVDAAADAAADVVLLAVGSPQQELLAQEMRASGRVGGTALCVGASVDFITGKQRRAPRLLRRLGLEWAWRLIGSPRRLSRRYLVDGPAIFPMVWRWNRDQGRNR